MCIQVLKPELADSLSETFTCYKVLFKVLDGRFRTPHFKRYLKVGINKSRGAMSRLFYYVTPFDIKDYKPGFHAYLRLKDARKHYNHFDIQNNKLIMKCTAKKSDLNAIGGTNFRPKSITVAVNNLTLIEEV